jgi:hypothetical protein
MRKYLSLLILFLMASSLRAQVPSVWLLDSTFVNHDGTMVNLEANGAWGSNGLNNEWLSEMVLGGHFNTIQKDRLLKQLDDRNRIGGDAHGAVTFWSFADSVFGNGNWGYQAGISSHYNISASFDKDLYRLMYYGNNPFRNDSLDFSNTSVMAQSYQKIGFGIFNKQTFSSIRLSVVSGQQIQELSLDRANWFTSFNGTSTSLDYAGDYFVGDTSKTGFGAGRGFGLCLDTEFNIPMKDGKGFISFAIHDIGYIRWNNALHYQFDSTFVWDGLAVDDVLNLEQSSLGVPKWQDTLGIQAKKVSEWRAMPTSVKFRMLRKINSKHAYEGGIHLRPNTSALPFVFLGLNHFVGKGLMISERVSFGDYGRFALGGEVQWKFSNRAFIRLGTNHAFGLISKLARGMSAYGGLMFNI